MIAAKPNRAGKIRILLVDDHPLLREGVALRIDAEPDLTVCGQAGDVGQALAALEQLQPDVAVVDISLPGRDGIELVKDIRAQFPRVVVLVLSLHDEALYAERALRAGARGYIMKSEPPDHLIHGIRRALAGEIAVGDKTVTRLLEHLSAAPHQQPTSSLELLTDRELEIFQLLGAGHQRMHIAKELNLSVKTIETHRANIRQKLGLANCTALLQYAVQFAQQTNTTPPASINR